MSLLDSAALQTLYHKLNTQHFDALLPPCDIRWSRRLTRAAGNISVRERVIKLSQPILVDAFRPTSLFPIEYSVCGVLCSTKEDATREILKHEMIHLWLFVQGLPSGHTAQFRHKARQIGQPRTRHEIALPAPKSGWMYACSRCGHEFSRRRRYSRAVACARCCQTWNKGQFDARFKLRGRRIAVAEK